jgi:hypothetical protein
LVRFGNIETNSAENRVVSLSAIEISHSLITTRKDPIWKQAPIQLANLAAEPVMAEPQTYSGVAVLGIV